MTKSSGTILAGEGRPEGRGTGTGPRTKLAGTILDGDSRPEGKGAGMAPFNIYSASVALLWTTALRAVAPPRDPRQPIGGGKRRQGKMRLLAGRVVVDGPSCKASNP